MNKKEKIENKISDFYVYVYLDPRKPGNYICLDFCFDYEPFYIGLGRNNRIDEHISKKALKFDTNKIKVNKILKIKRETGLDPVRIKVRQNLLYRQSAELERNLIKFIGRIDLKTGTLTNLTDGGDGIHNLSEESLRRAKENRKGKSVGEKNGMYGRKHSEESKQKMKNSRKRKHLTKEHKEKLSIKSSGSRNGMYGRKHSLESRKKISDNLKGKFTETQKESMKTRKRLKVFIKECSCCISKFETKNSNAKKCPMCRKIKKTRKVFIKNCTCCGFKFETKSHNCKRCDKCRKIFRRKVFRIQKNEVK